MAALPHLATRMAIIDAALKMNALGVNQGTSGNISVRIDGGLLITPSGLPYEETDPEDIVELGFDASYVGRHRPSSEWRFHRDILEHRPDVDVVLHTHSVHATALAVHERGIPAFHYMVGVAGGDDIRCCPYATFGTQALSDNALKALEGRQACLLGHHGVIVIARTLAQALWLVVEVETLARMYLAALQIGEPELLSAEEMARVREQMRRMSYGQAPDLDPGAEVPRPRAA